jgi:type III secretion system HrpB2-like protein
MSPIQLPVTPVAALKPITEATATSGVATVGSPTHVSLPAADPAQADRFTQMLEAVHVRNASGSNAASHPSAVSEFIDAQDQSFNSLAGSVDAFEHNTLHMSMPEMTAQMIDLQYRVTQAMIKVEVGVGFAQGGKGAVQNLMKSQ